MTFSSKPGSRRCPFATIIGSNLPAAVPGYLEIDLEVSVFTRFYVFPFREFPPLRPS